MAGEKQDEMEWKWRVDWCRRKGMSPGNPEAWARSFKACVAWREAEKIVACWTGEGYSEHHRFDRDEYTLLVNPETMRKFRVYDDGRILPSPLPECGDSNHPRNRGWWHERTAWVDPNRPTVPNREKVFADEWEKLNERDPGRNYGQGTLQDLFFEPRGGCDTRLPRMLHVLSSAERVVAATAIQWLGTNCGWGWLSDVFRKLGYEIRLTAEERQRRKDEYEDG
jgi:hypothetical protein